MARTQATGSDFAEKRVAGDLSKGNGVAPRFLDWIWHIKGTLPLAPGQSGEEAFEKLDPLFQERGTSHERQQETLVFSKKDPGSQDKMSIFDEGVLWIENGVNGAVLRYHLTSKALLACFLAPLLFLAFAQIGIALDSYYNASADADTRSSEAASEEEPAEEDEPQPLHWIDQALGAPSPEKADKTDEDKKEEEKDDGFSPTPAYVFAGLFFALYIVGRILEDRLIKAQFRKRLTGA